MDGGITVTAAHWLVVGAVLLFMSMSVTCVAGFAVFRGVIVETAILTRPHVERAQLVAQLFCHG